MRKLVSLVTAGAAALLMSSGGSAFAAKAPKLSAKDFEKAKTIYFDRCSGCHGALRKGATGPKITAAKMLKKKLSKLETIIYDGTKKGMPGWGKTGDMTRAETKLVSKYLQLPAPVPPEWGMKKMKKTNKVIVPVTDRPTAPMHDREIDNHFGVILRDINSGAIIDGNTKKVVNTMKIGAATHIFRASATGRYFYTIGRDGLATVIDLFMKKPIVVAQTRACLDARSIEVSKYNGPEGNYDDKFAVVGCYWPPQIVIMDGQTLEPLKIISSRSHTYDTNEYHPEPRVATIVASHYNPEWILAIKETGLIWIMDYSDLQNLGVVSISTERFLHDGGFDASSRYLLIAANMRNQMVVVDTKERKFVAKFETGIKPHPGRGANWNDPVYGRVSATTHLGEGKITVYGSDPNVKPQYAWKVVRTAKTAGPGLFLKTHPNSEHIWTDATIAKTGNDNQKICVFKKSNFSDKTKHCFRATTVGKITHFEYNKGGSELWASVWDKKNGGIIVFDDKTMKVKEKISGLVTPTGKWNVYNTTHDLY